MPQMLLGFVVVVKFKRSRDLQIRLTLDPGILSDKSQKL